MTEATPELKRGKGISPIWIIPIVALALGVWMVIHTMLTEGPEIEIRFNNAQGLEAGKTKVKYRNVQIGLVEEVRLSADLKQVVARVKLVREASNMLREDTRFWVVTARLGAGSVSGLDTVISGAYIEIFPGVARMESRKFVGLEAPPLTPAGTEGLRLQLVSDRAASVSTGDAVLYRGYRVGRVESARLDPKMRDMRYRIFIDAPFHTLVNSSVRFWDVSGVSVSAGTDGIKLNVGSLDTIVFGGVAFGVPPGLTPGNEVERDTEFRLYRSQDETTSDPYLHGVHYVVTFNQSLRGLLSGAPVEFKGIVIGRVERILLKESVEFSARQDEGGPDGGIPVLVYLEPGRMEMPDVPDSLERFSRSIARSVDNGLRATLATGNLVTGSKYVDLDFFPDAQEDALGMFGDYITIPTVSTGLQQVEQKVFALLDKLNALPLEATLESATAALDEFDHTLESLQEIIDPQAMAAVVAHLDEALVDLRRTVAGFSPDSELYRNLNASLSNLERVAGNIDSLTTTLARKPNAAVVGSKPAPDPIPEASRQ
jgi:paraquat-inducible protein B